MIEAVLCWLLGCAPTAYEYACPGSDAVLVLEQPLDPQTVQAEQAIDMLCIEAGLVPDPSEQRRD